MRSMAKTEKKQNNNDSDILTKLEEMENFIIKNITNSTNSIKNEQELSRLLLLLICQNNKESLQEVINIYISTPNILEINMKLNQLLRK